MDVTTCPPCRPDRRYSAQDRLIRRWCDSVDLESVNTVYLDSAPPTHLLVLTYILPNLSEPRGSPSDWNIEMLPTGNSLFPTPIEALNIRGICIPPPIFPRGWRGTQSVRSLIGET